MTERNPERFVDANNMFTLSVLSNDGFEEYIKSHMILGHKDNMKEDELRAYAQNLKSLKENNIKIYKRFYTKLYTLILEDNLNDEGTSHAIFDRVRKFGYYIHMINGNKGTAEEICTKYENSECIDTKFQ